MTRAETLECLRPAFPAPKDLCPNAMIHLPLTTPESPNATQW